MSENFRAVVVDSGHVTPNMLRVTFGGAELAAFTTSDFADEWVHLVFPDTAPERAGTGNGDRRRTMTRVYTARAVRRSPSGIEVDIDFYLHASGVASNWARQAERGMTIELGRPNGEYAPPSGTAWTLLVGDASALPAIGRIVESSSGNAPITVIAEIHSAAEEQQWRCAPPLEVRWAHNSGNGDAPSRLEGLLRAFEMPPGQGYVWMAGEARTARRIRRHLRHELGWRSQHYAVSGYWLERSEHWEAGYEAAAAELDGIWQSGEAQGRDVDSIRDDYDAALDRHGL